MARFLPAVEALSAVLPGLLAAAPASDGAGLDAEWFRQEGVGEGLAARLAGLRRLICALDLGELAERTGIDLAVAGGVYFEIERRFSIGALRERIGQGAADFWQERARIKLEDELGALGAALTAAALATDANPESFKTLVPKTMVERWAGSHGAAIERCDRLMDESRPSRPRASRCSRSPWANYASWRGVRVRCPPRRRYPTLTLAPDIEIIPGPRSLWAGSGYFEA